MKDKPSSATEVLFETARIGRYMKVTALHPASLVEVSVQGPANAEDADLKKLALNKLKRELDKRSKK